MLTEKKNAEKLGRYKEYETPSREKNCCLSVVGVCVFINVDIIYRHMIGRITL